jgi:DNA-binding transcriptional ArsR family regulator
MCIRYSAAVDFAHPIEALFPGAQGKILAVLAETTAELSIRTIARLAGVSVAQASRVLPRLAALGLVERHDVPPSSLFRLVPEHVSVQPLLRLARARDVLVAEMARVAETLPVVPLSVIAFGSFARGDSDVESDIDTVLVCPPGFDLEDDRWSESVDQWRTAVRRMSGNAVEVLEVGADDVAARLRGRRELWRDIRRDGLVVHGPDLTTLGRRARA